MNRNQKGQREESGEMSVDNVWFLNEDESDNFPCLIGDLVVGINPPITYVIIQTMRMYILSILIIIQKRH